MRPHHLRTEYTRYSAAEPTYIECACGRLVYRFTSAPRRFELSGVPHYCALTRPNLFGVELVCVCGALVVETLHAGRLDLRNGAGTPHECSRSAPVKFRFDWPARAKAR